MATIKPGKSRAQRRRKQRQTAKTRTPDLQREAVVGGGIFALLSESVRLVAHVFMAIRKSATRSGRAVSRFCVAFVRTFGMQLPELGKRVATAFQSFVGSIPVPSFSVMGILKKAFILFLEIALLGGVGVFLWYFHAPFFFQPLNLYDEGVTLMGAKRFAMGDVPYRDFFTIYGPLKFSLLGGVFHFFGAELYVARLFFVLISMLGFGVIFLFFRQASNLLYACLFTFLLLPFAQISLTPLLLIAIALWFSSQLQKPDSLFLPFVGGVLLGLLFLLRIDFGGLTGLALFLLLLIWWKKDTAVNSRQYLSVIGKIGFAFLMIVLPVFIALFWSGALSEFWRQAIVFPIFGTYQELRHLPWLDPAAVLTAVDGLTVDFFGLSAAAIWFFWPLPFAIAAVYWLWRASTGQFALHGFLTNVLLGSFAFGAFVYASHRSDVGHVLFLNLLSLIFFLHLLTQFRTRLLGLLFVPVVVVLMIFPASNYLETYAAGHESEKKAYGFFPTFFPSSPANDDLDLTLNFFKGIDKSVKVYVGVSDTSRIFVNNVMLPFLLEQPVATKYHELHTGIVTTAPVQAEVVDELHNTDYVVLWDYFECEPNGGCQSSGVTLVDDYIRANFKQVVVYGNYRILQRTDKSAE